MNKEFNLAQARLAELVSEHRRLSETLARKEHENRVAGLTLKELSSLPEATLVYRTLGKAFIRSELSQVQDRLRNVSASAMAEGERLMQRRAQLETSVLAAESKAKSLYEELQRS